MPIRRRSRATSARRTTILLGGLTIAHDTLLTAALSGLGYNAPGARCPDIEALRFGKEFGNRGQCNPTYFTVGNLIKQLTHLRDKEGMPVPEIIRTLRVSHRRRVRPLPLRHLRHRVPQGARRFRVRGLPRPALPAAGRPEAGDRRGAGLEINAPVLQGALAGGAGRRLPEPRRLSHPAVRGPSPATPTPRSRSARLFCARRLRRRGSVRRGARAVPPAARTGSR